MRILDFECVVAPDGKSRAVASQENGSACYVDGWGLVANGAIPPVVLDWLLRPRLRACWEQGSLEGTAVKISLSNPYEGEPPNKDKDPS